MKTRLLVGFVLAAGLTVVSNPNVDAARDEAKRAGTGEKSVLDFTVKDIDGKEVSLKQYKGDVLLVVNVASK